MNGAHYHLLLNHLPIIIPAIALIVLLTGFIFKSELVKRTGLFLFILAALCTYAADATGGAAAHVILDQHLAEKDLIHKHAEMADTFQIVCYLLGVLSVLGIWASVKKKLFARAVAIAVAVLSLAALYYGALTGNTGGEIRHTEIR